MDHSVVCCLSKRQHLMVSSSSSSNNNTRGSVFQPHRKPLVQFDISERAQLVSRSGPSFSSGSAAATTSSMPRSRKTVAKRRRVTRSSTKLRVVNGKVNIRIPGYGLQKLAPSSLIPFLPVTKVRQAAKRAFNSTHQRRSVRRAAPVVKKRKTKRTRRRQHHV